MAQLNNQHILEDIPNSLDITSDHFKVLITGFGPFGTHSINASWEAVSLLPDKIPNTNIEIVKEQVEVSYEYVDTTVPRLWKTYNPDLVIHVGVSDVAQKITIESCGHKDNYNGLDIYKTVPCGSKCKAADQCDLVDIQQLKTGLDLDSLVSQFETNKSTLNETLNVDISKVDIGMSFNAGRYLCEYIYFTSLCQDNARCLFIHVPPIDKPYSLQELTQSLLSIIYILSQQLLFKSVSSQKLAKPS